nr:MAG TPA: hypothetical protein [Caudoviricetes sp.]
MNLLIFCEKEEWESFITLLSLRKRYLQKIR